MKRISIIFRWHDLWVGIFFDTKGKTIYIFPIPMLGVRIKYGKQVSKKELKQWAKEIDWKKYIMGVDPAREGGDYSITKKWYLECKICKERMEKPRDIPVCEDCEIPSDKDLLT